MNVICDVEADGLHDPQNIWVIVCREVDTGEYHVFRPSTVREDVHRFVSFARTVDLWIGHNFLGFDIGVLNSLIPGLGIDYTRVLDTLVLSKLFYFSIPGGHSLDAWGERLGIQKSGYDDWSKWSPELESRCIIDTSINLELYKVLTPYIKNNSWDKAIAIEHAMAIICQDMHENGFRFDLPKAKELYSSLVSQLEILDAEIKDAFPPRSVQLREITPRPTKHGTLHRGDFRFLGPNPNLASFCVGAPFSTFKWVEFNPGSTDQINERLEGHWNPVEKTKSEKQWKVNERNLETLKEDAPEGARKLVQRFLLKKRVTTLEEWFRAVREAPSASGKGYRIHGTINHIGTWTHRGSHQNPNMGNVPSLFSKYGAKELKELAYQIGVDFRSCWLSDEDQVLVGTDADAIQLRIFAHYINDPGFTAALVSGNSKDGTDAHSLNALALGATRDQAKTFIYAFLLGVGVAKTAKILNCSPGEARERVQMFLDRYPGLIVLREERIPKDIERGYFDGFDGRKVIIPKTEGNMLGYVLGGYLQNGESCIMKHANLRWRKELRNEGIYFKQVNFVHDEWQTNTGERFAERVGECQADSIRAVAVEFGLNCPFKGNYKVGRNWYETH